MSDVFLCHPRRSAVGRFGGTLSSVRPDDLAATMSPVWLQVVTDWKGRGGIRSRITAQHGEVPASLHPA